LTKNSVKRSLYNPINIEHFRFFSVIKKKNNHRLENFNKCVKTFFDMIPTIFKIFWLFLSSVVYRHLKYWLFLILFLLFVYLFCFLVRKFKNIVRDSLQNILKSIYYQKSMVTIFFCCYYFVYILTKMNRYPSQKIMIFFKKY